MNIQVTSKKEILAKCRHMVSNSGFASISIRNVATECGTSVGTIYNYFPSKSDLLVAIIEDIWTNIFHDISDIRTAKSLAECVERLFNNFEYAIKNYPDFASMHSILTSSTLKNKGIEMMHKYFSHIKSNLILVLDRDANVREDSFNDNLSKEEFVNIIFSIIMSKLLKKDYDSKSTIELIKRSIY